MNKGSIVIFVLFIFISSKSVSQSFNQGDIILNGNIGAPHLFKGIIKLATKSQAFKENFDGVLEISEIKGMNPIAVKTEYGFTKFFGLGTSYSYWNINFNVTDFYNLQNQNIGNILTDSVDVYKIKISSSSFGIRPNLHLPLKSRKNDFYIGCGLGLTKNKLTINFSSTDAGRLAKKFGKDLEYDLSLPGGIYFAPSMGYRFYPAPFIALNFEVGYEKGAILQTGLILRFNTGKK